jgi:hypothetical protein
MNKKVYYPIIILVAIVIISAIFVSYRSDWTGKNIFTGEDNEPKTINQINAPSTEPRVSEGSGRTLESAGYAVPLVPKNESEKVVVPGAAYTTKESYQFSIINAKKWSPDARLIYIKSQGTVTLDGKSDQWQLMFGSSNKKAGYEIIVREDAVYSEKQVLSDVYGFALPQNWFDSPDAIVSIATLPQFSDATMSSISFYYNADGKIWSYAIATSKGVTSMQVK